MRLLIRALPALLILASSAAGQSGEFRGMWVSRFEWPDPDQSTCKSRIDEIMKTLAEHRFNAVIFQIRGQCDTMYPSPEEPWSPIISPDGADPGWDPMAYAVEAAHANHLEFHAYINTHVAWQHGKHQPPSAASHIFFKHFNGDDPAACDWLIHDGEGRPVTWGADNYVWIAPGVPEAQAYTRRQVMYAVTHYDVDGVHFDRIRTPTADSSHDPISIARSQTGAEGNPANLDFDAWTNDQFTRFLSDLYAQIMQVKPRMKVSSAPLGLVSRDRYPEYPESFHYGVTKCHQDAQAWLAAGAMDFVVPQIYWADNDNRPPDFSRILPDWVAHAAGRHIYAGHSVGVGVAELARQVQTTRELGGLGNVIFSYGGFKRGKGFDQYSRVGGVYGEPAGPPRMPWKQEPTTGIVLGTVKHAATGEPVVDAQIHREGSDYVALSSADGVFSFLQVPPGTYRLTVRKAGLPERAIESVVVTAGQVTGVEVLLGAEPVTVADAERPSADPSREDMQHEPRVVRTGETKVTQQHPPFVRWVLWVLIVAGLAVGGLGVLAVLNARRNRE